MLGARNVYRVYHDTDAVPMLPIFPFCHIPVGETAYLLRGPGALVSLSAHSSILMANLLANAAGLACQ